MVREDAGGLVRHVRWIDYWLREGNPRRCMREPVDILQHDLPDVIRLFDDWHARQCPADIQLTERLNRFIEMGELNAASREAWAIFKTRMVSRFGISEDLDGHQLLDRLFGNRGAASNVLPDRVRRGYLDLFKGLYSLYRNPTIHNDLDPNPSEFDAVIALVHAALIRIELTVPSLEDSAVK